jgi:hypothetical protein
VAELAAALDNPRLNLRCTDIRDVEFADRSYSIVVAVHVMHLIPRADLQTLIPKIAGWLDDGGIFCVTFVGTHDSWAPTPWRATVLLSSGLDGVDAHDLLPGLVGLVELVGLVGLAGLVGLVGLVGVVGLVGLGGFAGLGGCESAGVPHQSCTSFGY